MMHQSERKRTRGEATWIPRSGKRTPVWPLGAAVVLVVIAVLLLALPWLRREPEEARVASRPPVVNAPVAAAPEPDAPVVANREASPPESAPDPAPEREGIGLFPPPGTDPPKRGIIVPDGFELPPGYVRHYQVTDDGMQLPPILMFHPDHHPVDENGESLAIPEDRVVPPEMAPPGMPVETLEPPEVPIPMVEFPERQTADAEP